jgi:hypothetical protein
MTKRFLVPLSTDHVDYNVDSTSINEEGRLRWDSDFGTLSIGMEGGDVELPIGQKHGAFVKNESGVNIGKGKAVQFAGAKGGKITIAKAVANGTVDPKFMFGITAESIDDDSFGFVVTDGYVRGLNTSAIAVGTLLYFDPNTPGELTTTKPTAPAINIPIAVVTFSNAAAGVIFVRMQQEFPLDEIQDVKIENLQNGDVLTYNSASALWTNLPSSGSGSSIQSGTTFPESPTNNMLFLNTNNFTFYMYVEETWIEISSSPPFDGGQPETTIFTTIFDNGLPDSETNFTVSGGSPSQNILLA